MIQCSNVISTGVPRNHAATCGPELGGFYSDSLEQQKGKAQRGSLLSNWSLSLTLISGVERATQQWAEAAGNQKMRVGIRL